jgi:poly(A) polymerase
MPPAAGSPWICPRRKSPARMSAKSGFIETASPARTCCSSARTRRRSVSSAGNYDPAVPGRIRWKTTPEIAAQGRRGTSKWFGMATVNGALFASDVDSVFRRVDGPQPRWVRVLQFPRGVGDEGGAEVRGLTAVPNPQSLTGWPEEKMLVLATQMKIWRMRVPASADETHDHAVELDLLPWLSQRLGDPVIFAESAFNRLTPFQTASDAAPRVARGFPGRLSRPR